MANKMSDIATMLIGASSDYLHNGINLEAFRMSVNFALESIDRELKSEKQAIEAVHASQKPSTSDEALHIGDVVGRSELLKKFWDYFDKESVAVNCNDEERDEVIKDFFNSH